MTRILLGMGKRKIEKITAISDDNRLKVTLCKRKKGLMKKAIELSVLCNQKIFVLIHDESKQCVTHFMSHRDMDLLQIFNTPLKRDFYSNCNYERMGGIRDELDSDFIVDDDES